MKPTKEQIDAACDNQLQRMVEVYIGGRSGDIPDPLGRLLNGLNLLAECRAELYQFAGIKTGGDNEPND